MILTVMRDQDAIEKLRVDIEAGWQQVEEGKVSEFDPAAVKRRGREKLAALRVEARAALPAAIADLKREARANGLTDAEIDAELEARRKEPKS